MPYIVLLLANLAGGYFIGPWKRYLLATWHFHDHRHLLVCGIVLGASLLLAFFWDQYRKRDGSFVSAILGLSLMAALGVTCYLDWARKPPEIINRTINHTQVIRQTQVITRTVVVNHWYNSIPLDIGIAAAVALVIAAVGWVLRRVI